MSDALGDQRNGAERHLAHPPDRSKSPNGGADLAMMAPFRPGMAISPE